MTAASGLSDVITSIGLFVIGLSLRKKSYLFRLVASVRRAPSAEAYNMNEFAAELRQRSRCD